MLGWVLAVMMAVVLFVGALCMIFNSMRDQCMRDQCQKLVLQIMMQKTADS